MFSLFGGPGAAYVESKGTKVSRRTHHTGDIIMYKEKQWIINFTFVKTLTSLIIWEPGAWFTSTLYLIIIYISNIEAI